MIRVVNTPKSPNKKNQKNIVFDGFSETGFALHFLRADISTDEKNIWHKN